MFEFQDKTGVKQRFRKGKRLSLIGDELEKLATRWLPEGGFSGQPGSDFRPDATAWGLMAWHSAGLYPERVKLAQDRLEQSQSKDGRVSFADDHPEAYWPTADAIVAWSFSPAHQKAREKAVEFLLRTSGTVFKISEKGIVGHDTSIRGWTWIDKTHSWVEPTAMGLLALQISGNADHARAKEGYRLLLNRQLGSGGWNYGNTTTYCVELHPSMESTGLALHALVGHAAEKQVESSLRFLEQGILTARTPLWLGWSLLGLGAWGKRPAEALEWIEIALQRQVDYGSYNTAWLGVLLTAAFCEKGLAFKESGASEKQS